MLAIASLGLGAAQAASTWTGVTDSDWDTATNWTGGVPDGTDTATIGPGAAVTRTGNFDDGVAGNNTSQFTSLTIATGSTLSYTGGGDFWAETWNANGTITIGGVSGFKNTTTFNFGSLGSISIAGNMWGNGHAFNLHADIDIASAPSGTLISHSLLNWTGNLSSSLGTVTDTFTVLNGTGTQIADDTVPTNPGEYSFFTTSTSNGGLSVQYVTAVPEPSAAALLGLGGIALIMRRRK